jgi:L-2-hydroxycarboxylate dehydrogenase (NAD+)
MSEPETPADPRLYVRAEPLRAFVAGIFAREGLPQADAETVADCLVAANLRGVDTHGVFRVANYLKRLRAGLLNPHPNIDVARTSFAAAHVDGDNGMGAVVGRRAMQEAIAIAEDKGTAFVSIKHSNHFSMAAYYAMMALDAGLIGMVFTNASPALPPWGGRAPFLGTSPLAVAVPAGKQPPFVLDMAMSVLARGAVYMAAGAAKAIPPGLALDAEGRPTTDPQDLINGGTMLPFGGVKGAGLSMLMDILGGVLSGSGFAGQVGSPHQTFDRPQNVGHLFICFRPDLFQPRESFLARMDELILAVKAQPRAAGFDEILIPGEREARVQAERLAHGIPLSQAVFDALRQEAGDAPMVEHAAQPF